MLPFHAEYSSVIHGHASRSQLSDRAIHWRRI